MASSCFPPGAPLRALCVGCFWQRQRSAGLLPLAPLEEVLEQLLALRLRKGCACTIAAPRQEFLEFLLGGRLSHGFPIGFEPRIGRRESLDARHRRGEVDLAPFR